MPRGELWIKREQCAREPAADVASEASSNCGDCGEAYEREKRLHNYNHFVEDAVEEAVAAVGTLDVVERLAVEDGPAAGDVPPRVARQARIRGADGNAVGACVAVHGENLRMTVHECCQEYQCKPQQAVLQ